jgi:hypothetical protein
MVAAAVVLRLEFLTGPTCISLDLRGFAIYLKSCFTMSFHDLLKDTYTRVWGESHMLVTNDFLTRY